MLKNGTEAESSRSKRVGQSAFSVLLTLLAIEFLDELVFGSREAAWPQIRTDLRLSYTEIGLLLSLPNLVATIFIEPILGVLADVWRRRAIVLWGGIIFAVALFIVAVSRSFWPLLIAFALLSPSSGAFIGLAQATLMDMDAERHEHNMARWELAGSLGNVIGPLAFGLAVMTGAGWHGLFLGLSFLTLLFVFRARRLPFKKSAREEDDAGAQEGMLRGGIKNACRAVRRPEVVRWLLLLQFADLMTDGLHNYLALYFVDVVGLTDVQAGLSLIVWTCAGLPGDILLIPLLEHVRGLSYLRVSALLMLFLFPAFLLVPGVLLKLVFVGLIGFANAGWYSVLKAQVYKSMPGQSGTVMTLSTAAHTIGYLFPLALGVVAEHFGLSAMMWLLLLGPLSLLVGIPGKSREECGAVTRR